MKSEKGERVEKKANKGVFSSSYYFKKQNTPRDTLHDFEDHMDCLRTAL